MASHGRERVAWVRAATKAARGGLKPLDKTTTFPLSGRPLGVLLGTAGIYLRALWTQLRHAWAHERDHRRPALWLPVAAGVGVIVNLAADRDPSLMAGLIAFAFFACLATVLRNRPAACAIAGIIAAFAIGHASTSWRIARVAAPVVTRLTIANVTGFVEQVDLRREGARIVLRLTSGEGIAAENLPKRVRLTTRRDPGVAAGEHVALKARLLPPARAALPGGYDFARDAYFMGVGGVGNVLGRIEARATNQAAPLALRFFAAIDHARNALVARIASWLRADADGRLPATMEAAPCDAQGCVARLADGRAISLVLAEDAFIEDCERAWLVVTPLYAPSGCEASMVIDRRSLALSGATTLDLRGPLVLERHARSADEDRPWSRAPKARFRPQRREPSDEDAQRANETRMLGERLD